MATTDAVRQAKQTISYHESTLVGPDLHRPGSDRARLIEFGIHVWALIAHPQRLDGDISRTAEDYAVLAALAYYSDHQAAIDTRIAINADAA